MITASGRSTGEGIGYPLQYSWVYLVAQLVKNTPAMYGDLPNPGIKPRSPALQADSLPTEPQGKPLCFLFVCLFFHKTRTNNLKICMETQKTPNSQSSLEKEKESWKNQAA